MKKFFLMAVAAVLVSACGSSSDDGAGQPVTPPVVVGPGGGTVPFGPADATVTKISAVVSNEAEDQPEIDVTTYAATTPDNTEPVAI